MTSSKKKIISENFNTVLLIIKRAEQCEFCKLIASLNLNLYDEALNSVCLILSKENFFRFIFLNSRGQ